MQSREIWVVLASYLLGDDDIGEILAVNRGYEMEIRVLYRDDIRRFDSTKASAGFSGG